MSNSIMKAIRNPYLALLHLCEHKPFTSISDEAYIKLFFRAYQGYRLDLNNPVTFNEKIQWLKLYDRNPLYTELSDKYLVREYVREKIGEEYLVPLIKIWDSPDEINFDDLPNRFVMKCNHDSGSAVICENKEKLDLETARTKIKKAFKKDYYWTGREYNYKNIRKKIMCEEYLSDKGSNQLTDYKFFCFDSEPKFIQIDVNRFTDHTRNYYDTEWNFINVSYGCKCNSNLIIPKPTNFELMKELAIRLSNGIKHVRVDFYDVGDRVFFGEMTFHHGGGAMKLEPFEYDKLWGGYLHLPEV